MGRMTYRAGLVLDTIVVWLKRAGERGGSGRAWLLSSPAQDRAGGWPKVKKKTGILTILLEIYFGVFSVHYHDFCCDCR